MSADRLSVVDEIFLRTHRGFGLPIVLQGVWRSAEHVDRVDLRAVHANLALGRLGRRVVTPRLVGARRRWVSSADCLPMELRDVPLADAEVLDWADEQGNVSVDPEFGPGWRMSVARTADDGTVVSLVCSHALADAAGLIAAAGEAFEGSAPREPPRRSSDVADAISLVSSVTVRALSASARLVTSSKSRGELAGYVRSLRAAAPHEPVVATAVFELDSALTNAEFIHLVAQIAAELGDQRPIGVNVPFRSNIAGANAIGMATIDVGAADSAADIRAATKVAFGTPAGAPSGFPADIVQLLPDSVAASMTSSPGAARVLCSNIGSLPTSISSIGGHAASPEPFIRTQNPDVREPLCRRICRRCTAGRHSHSCRRWLHTRRSSTSEHRPFCPGTALPPQVGQKVLP